MSLDMVARVLPEQALTDCSSQIAQAGRRAGRFLPCRPRINSWGILTPTSVERLQAVHRSQRGNTVTGRPTRASHRKGCSWSAARQVVRGTEPPASTCWCIAHWRIALRSAELIADAGTTNGARDVCCEDDLLKSTPICPIGIPIRITPNWHRVPRIGKLLPDFAMLDLAPGSEMPWAHC